MRTTVDLPPAVHRRATQLAAQRHTSLSAVLADLVVRGLAQTATPVTVEADPRTGLPVLRVGRSVTAEDVERLLDDDTE